MPQQPDSPSSPPAVIASGGVFLPASVCHPLWLAVRAQLDRNRADGGRVRPEVAAALDVLRAAALAHLSAPGPAPRTAPDIEAGSSRDLVATDQLAGRLGVTPRHARRLADAAGITPAARGLWHADDAAHLIESYRRTT
ncbi:hypothetical protein GCM10029992_12250 [Glycomyces albus]